MRLDVVDPFYETTSVYIGFNLASFPETSCLWKGVPVPTAIVFHCFLKYHLKGTTKFYKEIHVGLKLEWGLYDKY